MPIVWLTWKIGARRNWARVTWIVVTVMGTLVVLSSPQRVTQLSLLGKANFMLQTGLQWATVALLLTPSARRWFKRSIPSA
jgi:threonine/homoserine efflux transporter RhtA